MYVLELFLAQTLLFWLLENQSLWLVVHFIRWQLEGKIVKYPSRKLLIENFLHLTRISRQFLHVLESEDSTREKLLVYWEHTALASHTVPSFSRGSTTSMELASLTLKSIESSSKN